MNCQAFIETACTHFSTSTFRFSISVDKIMALVGSTENSAAGTVFSLFIYSIYEFASIWLFCLFFIFYIMQFAYLLYILHAQSAIWDASLVSTNHLLMVVTLNMPETQSLDYRTDALPCRSILTIYETMVRAFQISTEPLQRRVCPRKTI